MHRSDHKRQLCLQVPIKELIPVDQVIAFFRKDPVGVVWFLISFSILLIAKWWFLQPKLVNEQNCLVCVLAILLLLSVLITLILSLFWALWETKRQQKGVIFLFLFSLGILFCTFLFDLFTQGIFSQLYYGGILRWQEAEISFLMDDFLKHSTGLYLAVLMMYSMARIAVCKTFVNRKYVLFMNSVFFLAATILLFMGMFLY